ncbi:hypothetical protein ACIBHX_30065 [Nonomuraea sp. NPDC050536]|uniref:hypothetical protein n=1 Tax=Nonomuraea sp. NPDC050536 TaxID=3364366 RepID=UPI0037CBE818
MKWNRHHAVKIAAICAGIALLGTAAALIDDARSEATLETLTLPDRPTPRPIRPAILRAHPTAVTATRLTTIASAAAITGAHAHHHSAKPRWKGHGKHHHKYPHHGHSKK